MSCCTRSPRKSFRPIAKGGSSTSAGSALYTSYVEVTGTWDFKWPHGKKIRVAFQKPNRRIKTLDFDKIVRTIRDLAETWTLKAGKPTAGIGFTWTGVVLPPAVENDLQNASPYLPYKNQDDYTRRDYDVLVSLDPLPLDLGDPLTRKDRESVFLPQSQLGSFARRLDYGVPTIYLGPIAPVGGNLADYFAGHRLSRYYVLHEFGHALGLGHAHQAPPRREHWKKGGKAAALELIQKVESAARRVAEARGSDKPSGIDRPPYHVARVRDAKKELHDLTANARNVLVKFLTDNGVAPPPDDTIDDFIVAQIVETWPGNVAFSDWRNDDEPSIMDSPYFECMLGIHRTSSLGLCPNCDRILERYEPYAKDIEWLQGMYPLEASSSEKIARPSEYLEPSDGTTRERFLGES